LHFVLLAGKVGDFDTELKVQITDEEAQTRLRHQLPSNIFVQFLAGSRDLRTGRVGTLLQLIAWISLVIGPVALLVFFELQFLPYHDEPITWWHRIGVLADIVLLWLLWPSIVRGERAGLSWRDLRRGKILALGVASQRQRAMTRLKEDLGEELTERAVRFADAVDGNLSRQSRRHGQSRQ
jgi:hypothetical protein